MSRHHKAPGWIIAGLLIFVSFTNSLQGTFAQGDSRTFPETGKTIQGKFLNYWDTHGGVTQQGYPVSEEMQEKSDTDGKTYTVQYFERAVFEMHPENQTSNDILLSLLGVFAYRDKYPGGASGQSANNEVNSMSFSETGKRLGGRFLEYWKGHGAIAQQGFPISDEFTEISSLNGQAYKVQYFERAVFELHLENQAPYDVLLSQLGTLQYRKRYLQPTPTVALPSPTSVPTKTPVPIPAATSTAIPITSCEGVPPTKSDEMRIGPTCIPLYGRVAFTGVNFGDDSEVGVYSTMPNGQVFAAPFHVPVRGTGETLNVTLYVDDETPYYGVWTVTMEGVTSHRKVFGYFKLVPAGSPIPDP